MVVVVMPRSAHGFSPRKGAPPILSSYLPSHQTSQIPPQNEGVRVDADPHGIRNLESLTGLDQKVIGCLCFLRRCFYKILSAGKHHGLLILLQDPRVFA